MDMDINVKDFAVHNPTSSAKKQPVIVSYLRKWIVDVFRTRLKVFN